MRTRLTLVLFSLVGLTACENFAPTPQPSPTPDPSTFSPAPSTFAADDHVVPMNLDPNRPQPTPTVHSLSRTQERLPPDAP